MRKLLLMVFLADFCLTVGAAGITTPLPQKCEAFRPDILYTPMLTDKNVKTLLNSGDYGQRSSRRGDDGHEFWIVFSDREDNPTYVAPNSKTVYKRLGFNDKVRIAQIKDGWALVYTEPKEQETFPRFSSMMEWQGWIPMDNLLLWNTCPANEKGIYNKAMLCVNLDEDLSNDLNGKCFKNPDNTGRYENARTDFTYFFVMKEQGDMVLLSTQNTMNGQTYRVLYGWVVRSSFVAWNQRSCLEPTWDPDDVEFFAKSGVKVNIYDDRNMTNKASWVEFTTKSGAQYSPDMYRMAGEVLRYPILDDNSDKYWNCSTFSSPGGGAINEGTTIQPKGGNVLKKNMDALVNINIAFVMDGTQSMGPYFPAVKQTIKEINKFFPTNWHVKVGFLIYRDKHDGEYVTEMVPLTSPDNEKLAAWLDRGGEYGIKSGHGDKTMEEALYYGIDSALDAFNFNPEESNIMFVIGDCGDAGDFPEITVPSLVKKLVDFNVSLMGFQVRNDESVSAFPRFNSNMTTLIKEGLSQKYAHLVEMTPNLEGTVEIQVKRKRGEYEFSNNAKNEEGDLFIGSHKSVQSGAMDVNELRTQIENVTVTVKADIDHKLELYNDALSGKRGTSRFGGTAFTGMDITGPQLDEAWLRARLGDDGYKALRRSNATVSFKGYTPKRDASDHEYYKTVVFISQQELNTMMTRLAPLYEVAQRKGNDREPYVKAMKALVQGMIPNISDSEMNAKGYDEVMAMVAGLNAKTIMSKGRTITEVANTKAVAANEYQAIVNKFQRQYKKLQRIQKQPYAFVREFNGAKYYWIPTDDLP